RRLIFWIGLFEVPIPPVTVRRTKRRPLFPAGTEAFICRKVSSSPRIASVTPAILGEDDTFRQMKASVPAGNSGRRFVRLTVTGGMGTSNRPIQKIKRR